MSGRLAGTAAAAIVAAGSLTGGAVATFAAEIERTADTWQTCENPLIENPFERFGDERDYVLAPSGAFEHVEADLSLLSLTLTADLSRLGWRPSPGAGITAGNESYYVRRATDGWSLTLPEGASATSPAMCVDLHYPHMRLVSNARSGLLSAADTKLRVRVIYPEVSDARFRTVKRLNGVEGSAARLGWRVSDDIPLRPERGGSEPGPRLAALRFTALSGDWRIDDIYVDPRRHR